jgi:hypothetical protein
MGRNACQPACDGKGLLAIGEHAICEAGWAARVRFARPQYALDSRTPDAKEGVEGEVSNASRMFAIQFIATFAVPNDGQDRALVRGMCFNSLEHVFATSWQLMHVQFGVREIVWLYF